MTANHRKKILIGIFRKRTDAEVYFSELKRRGYQPNDVSLVLSDQTRQKHYTAAGSEPTIEQDAASAHRETDYGFNDSDVTSLTDLIERETTQTIPGHSLVIAGPLASLFANSKFGSSAKLLVNTLVHLGVPQLDADVYHYAVQAGQAVLLNPMHVEDTNELSSLMSTHSGEHVTTFYCIQPI